MCHKWPACWWRLEFGSAQSRRRQCRSDLRLQAQSRKLRAAGAAGSSGDARRQERCRSRDLPIPIPALNPNAHHGNERRVCTVSQTGLHGANPVVRDTWNRLFQSHRGQPRSPSQDCATHAFDDQVRGRLALLPGRGTMGVIPVTRAEIARTDLRKANTCAIIACIISGNPPPAAVVERSGPWLTKCPAQGAKHRQSGGAQRLVGRNRKVSRFGNSWDPEDGSPPVAGIAVQPTSWRLPPAWFMDVPVQQPSMMTRSVSIGRRSWPSSADLMRSRRSNRSQAPVDIRAVS